MVPDAPEVETVLLGEHGAAAGLAEGALVVDMSTIAPTSSRSIAGRLRERDVDFLDAPVTGSRPKAEDATLTIMVGGPADVFAECKPLLEAMGQNVIHCGEHGMGEVVKVVNNLIAGVSLAVVAEAFNIGVNDGELAGQTVAHAHIHVIPRRRGDVPDPRGGVRWVVPDRARYWTD
jgi:3-hydroxyisobutyrate dehydrogenase-like beta-hydroxyacid dehydrogenase